MKNIFPLVLSLLSVNAFAQQKEALSGKVYLIVLLGQSNMEGLGKNEELPDHLKNYNFKSKIFHGNPVRDDLVGGGDGFWSQLTPGHGSGFSCNNNTNHLAQSFGIELSLAYALEKRFPDKKFAFIKYAKGGSALAPGVSQSGSWTKDSGNSTSSNQMDFCLKTIQAALASKKLLAKNKHVVIQNLGMVFLQGEADACNERAAANYEANLRTVFQTIENALQMDAVQRYVVRINHPSKELFPEIMPFYDQVVRAQESYCRSNAKSSFLPFSSGDVRYLDDHWHYQSDTYVKIGERVAKEMIEKMSQ